MQVFKSFFKVLNVYKNSMIMYMVIFSIMLIIFTNVGEFSDTKGYTDVKCKFSVFDYDESMASKGLVSYLEKTNKRVDVSADEKEELQEALYNREADAIIRIPDGFEEKLLEGRAEGLIDLVTISGSQNSMLVESDLDGFLKMVEMYIKQDYSLEDAIEKSELALSQKVEVMLPDGKEINSHSMIYTFFSYLGWVMVCLIITGVASVLQVFSRKELKARIECSSYNFLNFNKELVLALMVAGLGICGIFAIMAAVMFKSELFSFGGFIYILNMICYMLVSLSLAFLISKLTTNKEALSMIANVLSLGMAFLCGIFVPIEFLGKGVIRVAHFLPAYWYNHAVMNIDFHLSDKLGTIFVDMGVQILFAIAILVVGMVADRRKKA